MKNAGALVKCAAALFAVGCLGSCGGAMEVAMMSRSSGESFRGELLGDGSGSGSMTVNFHGQQCSGPATRVATDSKTVVGSAWSFSNTGQSVGTMAAATEVGDSTVRALLSCADGRGLRCTLKGRDLHGGGECSTDDGQVFDILVNRKSS